MARFDKVIMVFRAPVNIATPASGLGSVGRVTAVSLNTSGKVVIGGAAATDLVGVICVDRALAVDEIVDVMVLGEIVDCTTTDITGMTSGDQVYSALSGQLSDTNTGKKIGSVVDSARGRLVVNVGGSGTGV
jgi:FAD/FMN-containing dehydrogenase